MVHAQDVKECRIHQQKNCNARQRGSNHRTGQVLRRILVFFNKIDGRVPTVVCNNNALQREHQSEKDAVRMDEPVPRKQRSSSSLNGNCECGDDECDETESFDQAGKLLCTTAGLKANPIENGERCQHQGRQEPYMSREHRQKLSDEFCECDRQVCVGDGLDSEVAATDNESGLLPEGPTRVNVPPAATGKHATELGHGTAAQESIDSSQEPNPKDQPAIPQVARNLTRCAENARADRVSDTNSKAEAYAEYAQQVAAATACAKLKEATQGMLGLVRNRWRQDFVYVGHKEFEDSTRIAKRGQEPEPASLAVWSAIRSWSVTGSWEVRLKRSKLRANE